MIAGLGNPGARYAGSRHNAGFLVADLLAGRAGIRLHRHRSHAQVGRGTLADHPVVLAKPMTFMNLSGRPVGALARYYKIPPSRLIVIHDELDLPFGAVRLKSGGGDNGHNGLRSVTACLRTRDYFRVRVGIGRPPADIDPVEHVLRDFSPDERKDLPAVLERGADAVQVLLEHGLAAAQSEFHAR